MTSEIAKRYAAALYDAAADSNGTEKVFQEIRALQGVFSKEPGIREFIHSPSITGAVREKVFSQALNELPLSAETKGFINLLAKKNRLRFFGEIVQEYEFLADQRHGVTRGTVRSATILGPDERVQLESKISDFIKKQVIFTYREDADLIGGLIAEVGSFSFDDTLKSHIQRLRQDLTRRTQ
jgi:F-type H+-transporting ATPase subunit delta